MTPILQRSIQANIASLEGITFSKIICSELIRTKETAIEHGYSDFLIDNRTNEYYFGHYEGQDKFSMSDDDKITWIENPIETTFGETMRSFQFRIDSFINDISYHDGNILLFTHGVVGRYIVAREIYKTLHSLTKSIFQIIS